MNKPVVTIRYCTGCRWLLRAAWIAQELLSTFEQELGGVLLQPDHGGMLEIRAGDAVLFSRADHGPGIDIAHIKRRVRDHIAPGKSLGHADRGSALES